jgi:hypothetical protein
LQKDKKSSTFINRPVIQYENKAELKFDLNYIMQSSPTNTFGNKLITLSELAKEKAVRRINMEMNTKVEVVNYKGKDDRLDNDDSFFDFKGSDKLFTQLGE